MQFLNYHNSFLPELFLHMTLTIHPDLTLQTAPEEVENRLEIACVFLYWSYIFSSPTEISSCSLIHPLNLPVILLYHALITKATEQ